MLRQKHLAPTYIPSINNDIKQWLKHRQEVLVHYSQLCSSQRSQGEILEIFCQLLMDYVSFGHFKMFEKLAETSHFFQSDIPRLDKKLLDKIALTTDITLDFNDKYTQPKSLADLPKDLSVLGENLANRMDWEDQLIKAYSNFYSGL